MIVDHVVLVVREPVKAAQDLFERYGLGSERGPYHTFSGTRNWSVPLTPPSYLELLSISDRDVAESSKPGRRVIECEEAGGGLLTWAILVEDVEVVSQRWGLRSSTTPRRTRRGLCAGGGLYRDLNTCPSSSIGPTTRDVFNGGRICTTE